MNRRISQNSSKNALITVTKVDKSTHQNNQMSGNKLNENENNSKFKSHKKSVNKSNKFASSIKKHHNNIGGNGPIAHNGVSRTSMDAYCTSQVHLEVS